MASASPKSAAHPAPPEAAAPRDDSLWRFQAAGVLVFAAVLYLARLGARALWSSEFRWAEVAREMIATHNYFWPTLDGIVYFDKPLGTYWVILLATPFTGGMNELAARLPCAIAGLLAVAFLMLLTRRLYDSRTAVWAGFILATSFSFVFFSRTASADVETVAGELAAILLFMRNEERRGGWWVIGLWLIMAATSMMKGLLGFALPILIIGVYSCLRDGWAEFGKHTLNGSIAKRLGWLVERNRWFFNWQTIPAIAAAAVIYFAPFEISQRLTHSDQGARMAFHESVTRFFHPWDHRGPVYLYVYVIFALMAPWSALLPAALVETHRVRHDGNEPARADRFALVYFWATFVFFTLSGSRRSYYLLPILPAAAMLIARTIAYSAELKSRLAKVLLYCGYAIVAIAGALSLAALLPPSWVMPGHLAKLPPAPDRAVIVAMWVLSVAGIIYALRGLTRLRIGISIGLIAYCAMVYIYIFATPAADAYRPEKPFAYTVLKLTGGRTDGLAFYKTLEGDFYLRPQKPLPKFMHLDNLKAAVDDGTVRWFIVRRRDLPKLAVPETILAAEASYPWETAENLRNKVLLVRVGKLGGQQ
ncbi:MAG: ArnT family glycosyltransferase [Candidatus Binataceae bacterium]